MPRVTKSEYESLAALRYALRQFLHFSEQAARLAGLTPQQHQALLAVKGFPKHDTISIAELAERLKIRHHSAVGLANRLISEQLLKRQTDPADRRRVLISVTAKGEAILEKLSEAHRAELKRTAPVLTQLLQEIAGNIPIREKKR